MAKITKLPGQAIIDGFKGTLDFYLWKGIACVRKWPRSPGHDRAPAVESKWPAFSFAASSWLVLAPEVRNAFNEMAKSIGCTGRDIYVKAYIDGTAVTIS